MKKLTTQELEGALEFILREMESRGLNDYTVPPGDFGPEKIVRHELKTTKFDKLISFIGFGLLVTSSLLVYSVL